jgi:hypothetical protein
MELRDVSLHPWLRAGAENRDATPEGTVKNMINSSEKLFLLAKLLAEFKTDRHRVIIFAQLVKALANTRPSNGIESSSSAGH